MEQCGVLLEDPTLQGLEGSTRDESKFGREQLSSPSVRAQCVRLAAGHHLGPHEELPPLLPERFLGAEALGFSRRRVAESQRERGAALLGPQADLVEPGSFPLAPRSPRKVEPRIAAFSVGQGCSELFLALAEPAGPK